MKLQQLALLALLALPSFPVLAVPTRQEPDGIAAFKSADAVSPLKAASVQLPDGNSAWTVRVIRTGGFAGTMLDISVTSAGRVKCDSPVPVRCPTDVPSGVLPAVGQVTDPKFSLAGSSSLTDRCRDCFVTRITVKHRRLDGKVQTYFAYWDDVTAARRPTELVSLANAVLSVPQ